MRRTGPPRYMPPNAAVRRPRAEEPHTEGREIRPGAFPELTTPMDLGPGGHWVDLRRHWLDVYPLLTRSDNFFKNGTAQNMCMARIFNTRRCGGQGGLTSTPPLVLVFACHVYVKYTIVPCVLHA